MFSFEIRGRTVTVGRVRSRQRSALTLTGVGAGLLVSLLPLLVGCGRHVTPAECTAMLDRYVDMTIPADPSLPPSQGEMAREMKKEAERRDDRYRRASAQCMGEVTRPEYECAMKAPSPNDWEACIQ